MEFNNFLNQAQEIFNIAVFTISHHVILEKTADLSTTQRKSVIIFYNETTLLINFTRKDLEDMEYGTKEEYVIKIIFFVSRLYFASLIFVQNFYNLSERYRKKNGGK